MVLDLNQFGTSDQIKSKPLSQGHSKSFIVGLSSHLETRASVSGSLPIKTNSGRILIPSIEHTFSSVRERELGRQEIVHV